MLGDFLSYALLASVFIVTGLRALIGKPNKLSELPLGRTERKRIDKNQRP